MDKNILKNKIEKLINHYKAGNFVHVIKEGQIVIKKIPNNIFLTNLIVIIEFFFCSIYRYNSTNPFCIIF